jgi:hypothetical protein
MLRKITVSVFEFFSTFACVIEPLDGSVRVVCVAALPRFMKRADIRKKATVSAAKICFFVACFPLYVISACLLTRQT